MPRSPKKARVLTPLARRRAERAVLASHAPALGGVIMHAMPKQNVLLLILPYRGGYTSSVIQPHDAAKLADWLLEHISQPEQVPTVRKLIHNTWAESQATIAEQAVEIWRLRAEVFRLRHRVCRLERDIASRVPPYSDSTALVLLPGKERAA